MKSAFLVEPGSIELRDVPIPRPDAGELIIKITAALTCGTDLKAFRRGHPKMPMPTPFGHEFSGIVVDAGASVNGYHEGDPVMTVHTAPCGECYYCRRQKENLCEDTMRNMLLGAYSEYIKLPSRVVKSNSFHKPSELSFEEAAFLEPLACVVHGMEPLNLLPEDTVLIIGAGAIGLLHLLSLRAKGISNIVVAGKHAERLKLAEALGAKSLIDAGARNTFEVVRALTGDFGANWVFECTGRPEVWELSFSLAARGGTVIFFGGCPTGTSVTFDTARFHYDEISVVSPFHFTPRDVQKSYQLLAERQIDARPLISGHYPLTDLEHAFDRLKDGHGIKFAIQP